MKLKILLVILVLFMGAGLAEEDVLTLPDGLTVVEAEAFMNDVSLGAVVVPEGALEIGARAFAGSSVTEITLPESLTSIAGDAFSGCEDILFRVPENSYAHRWAEEMGLNPSVILPYTYKLRADTLEWELVELPPEPEPELTSEEALDIILGGGEA